MNAGILSQISFAKETTWGTAVTPNKSVSVRPTGGIIIKENVQVISAIKGQLQKNYTAIKGKVAYEGDFTLDAFADYIGHFLLSALGLDTPATHSGETIVYDHVFTEAATKPSYTIEQAIDVNTRRFAGCFITGFKLAGKVGAMLEFTPSIIAKTQASSSEITGAFTTVPAFNFAQLQVKIGGSVLAEVESFELEYKSGLNMVYALGSNEPSFNAIEGGSMVSGKIDLYLDNAALTRLTNYLALNNESIELIATGPAIGTAANYVFDVLVPKAFYTAAESKITDNHNLLSVSFEGIYDTATSKLIGVTLTNLLATY